MTYRDWDKIVAAMGFAPPCKQSHAMQPRYSNECGLHVIWAAALQQPGQKIPIVPPPASDYISLAKWRAMLEPSLRKGLTADVRQTILANIEVLGSGRALPIVTGLHNNRFMCYANAVVQALAQCKSVLAIEASEVATAIRTVRSRSAEPATLPESFRLTDADGHEYHDAADALAQLVDRSGELTARLTGTATSQDHESPFETLLWPVSLDTDAQAALRNSAHFDGVSQAPQVLAISIERGTYAGRKKVVAMHANDTVTFGAREFELRAAVVHVGGGNEDGHYVAVIRNPTSCKWVVVDDTKIYPAVSVNKDHASILIYERQPDPPSGMPMPALAPPQQHSEAIDVDAQSSVATEDREREHADHVERVTREAAAPGSMVSSIVVQRYVQEMRRTEKGPIAFFGPDDTADIVKSYRTRYYNAKSWETTVARLAQALLRAERAAFIVCHNNHYVCAVATVQENAIELFDSYEGYHIKTRTNLVKAIAHAVQTATGVLSAPPAVCAKDMPQQLPASNDCALYALTSAWYLRAPKDWEVITRRDLVEACVPSCPRCPAKPERESHKSGPLRLTSEHPIAHKQLKEAMKLTKRGTMVELRWTDRDGRHRLSCGDITIPGGTPGLPARVKIRIERCETCEEWHAADDMEIADAIPIPYQDYMYFAVREISEVPAAVPHCGASDIDGDEPHDATAQMPVAPAPPPTLPRAPPVAPRKQRTEEPGAAQAREPLAALPTSDPLLLTGAVASKWFIHKDRPPGIHNIVWQKMAESTRRAHRRELHRIKLMDPEVAKLPLAKAIVDCTMRDAKNKNWAWSTISSKLSSTATAVKNLHIYTTCTSGYDLRADPYYADALRMAQREARNNAIRPAKSDALPVDQMEKLRSTIHRPAAVNLLNLSWYLAARVGDVRQIAKQNLTIHEPGSDVDEVGVRVQALFTKGKGAHFWGPYTIQAYVPLPIAKALKEHQSRVQGDTTPLFMQRDQDVLSYAVNSIEGCSLRSIRKGSIVHFAECGANDDNLQMLSGHKRKDTLLRYLEWGKHSSEAARAAHARARLSSAKQRIAGGASDRRHPMWMGPHSGAVAAAGKRVPAPPELFPKRPPAGHELGLTKKQDTASWPLKLKKVPCIKWEALDGMVESPDLYEALRKARKWITSPEHYGVDWPAMHSTQIPFSSFTAKQVLEMMEYGKMVPVPEGTEIKCAAKGFPTPQASTEQLRPVFEPLNNAVIDREALPPLSYPSRLQRRQRLATCKYFFEFDFSSYFDEIELAEKLHPYYVIRVREPVPVVSEGKTEHHHCFALTREPMGASHSAHVAQTVTWAICEPIIKRDDVVIASMIDNVGIGADDAEAFLWAVRTFVERCDRAGATIKNRDAVPTEAHDIIAAGAQAVRGPTTFLGETWENGTVRNSDNNVDKLRRAFDRLRNAIDDPLNAEPEPVTRRQVAAAIGLCTYMASTIGLPMNRFFPVIKTYADIARQAQRWDDPMRIDAKFVNELGKLVGPLLANNPVRPSRTQPPSIRNEDYDAIAIIDASSTGFGAYVSIKGEVYELKSGFEKALPHSAWSEPEGGRRVARWIKQQCPGANVAIVSDHVALTTGQRRWWSGHGGVSTAYYLNAFFEELYSDDSGQRIDVFYVNGEENPADAPSRANKVGDPLRVKRSDVEIPPLSSFQSAPRPRDRPWWNV